MRKLQILKTFIDLFWFFTIIAIVFSLFFIPNLFLSKQLFDIPFKINGQTITVIDFSTKMIFIIYIAGFYIFSFGIYKFRQLVELFRKKIIFESENSKLLNQIGWCFLIASVLFGSAGFLYSFIKDNNYDIVLSNGFGSVLFTCSIGLFFMVLSEIFKIAKK